MNCNDTKNIAVAARFVRKIILALSRGTNVHHAGRRAVAFNGRRPWHRTLATEVDTRLNDAKFEQVLREGAGLTATTEATADRDNVSPKPLAQPGRRRANEPKKDSIVDAYLTFKHMRRFIELEQSHKPY